ncbi:MAG: flagellar motor protein MotB [Eubacterium sp.]|nr:flagellar motor protein MotB [Eubacterium sp.]
MAKKQKQEDAPAGSPAWMATFSDLMNLLLCFFVLLFAMSSVDAAKFELVVASLQSTFSVLSGGTDTLGDGDLVGKGVSMMTEYDVYLNKLNNSTASPGSEADAEGEHSGSEAQDSDSSSASGDIAEEYEEMSLAETEAMAAEVEAKAEYLGIQDLIDVSYTSDYVKIEINGSLLFDSGSADVKKDAYELLSKICQILEMYEEHIIEIEGHTDNVPISNDKFANNKVLSAFRALSVADYVLENTDIDPYYIKYSGRGEYDPVADNSTEAGRARNRRVEIHLYNSLNS